MKNLKIIICVLLLASLVGVVYACEESTKENLIIIQEKIVILKAISFDGLAGGLGVPQVRASNVSQFLSLADGERVSSTANHREDIGSICKYQKSYWVFVEDRTEIVVYEKTYYRPGYDIPNYDENEIYFHSLR